MFFFATMFQQWLEPIRKESKSLEHLMDSHDLAMDWQHYQN